MYYEINVSKNGIHFFATHSRSAQDSEKAKELIKKFQEVFPVSEGYAITCSYNPEVLDIINVQEFIK